MPLKKRRGWSVVERGNGVLCVQAPVQGILAKAVAGFRFVGVHARKEGFNHGSGEREAEDHPYVAPKVRKLPTEDCHVDEAVVVQVAAKGCLVGGRAVLYLVVRLPDVVCDADRAQVVPAAQRLTKTQGVYHL
jgi:hypothetical protein